MKWHATRDRRVRKWQEAQHSVNTLISAVVKKTVPQLQYLNQRLRDQVARLKKQLNSANMSNAAHKRAQFTVKLRQHMAELLGRLHTKNNVPKRIMFWSDGW